MDQHQGLSIESTKTFVLLSFNLMITVFVMKNTFMRSGNTEYGMVGNKAR